MSMEEALEKILDKRDEKLLIEIEKLLNSHGYKEAPRFLKVPEAAEILRIGKTATYELCRQSEHNGFPAIKEGQKIRIPYNALMNWIDQQSRQAN
ncbi:helix-turn-helix domain-containing protein [Oceanobacillus kimchii]|uniref:helix-turn-helix domain-containing protein n=1 Tax=Oceanobacillus kimchii TaxID=746691 RepID=UPI0021A3D549|nr:helix-turn-helix domain-containing protein [Oceanobacillus kimchii]MCT1577980.1 helix-turn-helix domain-containing protein [Oceanobacillus kimchii]MCT2137540.1 helix-turn-helix domain-containing protein [Oceanobacillus kimchii]